MTSAQMLAHCSVALEAGTGDKPRRQQLIGKIFAPFVRTEAGVRAAVWLKGTRTGQWLESRGGQHRPANWGGMGMFLQQQIAANDPTASRIRGNILEALNRTDEGITDYKNALAQDPFQAESREALVRLRVDQRADEPRTSTRLFAWPTRRPRRDCRPDR